MSLLPIRRWPDPILSQPCALVEDPGAQGTLAQDMLETMYAAPGRGLAAPQVGQLLRLFVMDVTWKEGQAAPVICINPEIVDRAAEEATGPEGCLSIPGVTAQVARALWIDLRWMTPDGLTHTARLDGAAAIIAQHEIDRLAAGPRAELEAAYAG